jgi:type II secretory pathway pseudopilin PulG
MKRYRSTVGFTLIELLVVVGLIAGLAFLLVRGLSGGRSAALQSAQATVANLISAARTKAMASGYNARVLMHNDPHSDEASKKYLRYLVLQTFDGTTWTSVSDVFLPHGVGILPRDLTTPSGLVNPGQLWQRSSDGTELRSTALRATTEHALMVNSTVMEQWTSINFTPAGTTQNSNALVIGSVISLPPSDGQNFSSPVQFDHPQSVRGMIISAYGVTVLVNGREGF